MTRKDNVLLLPLGDSDKIKPGPRFKVDLVSAEEIGGMASRPFDPGSRLYPVVEFYPSERFKDRPSGFSLSLTCCSGIRASDHHCMSPN